MSWLHTWAGLVVGWIVFFIFLTGTAGYFDDEIDRWMQPERPLPSVSQQADVRTAMLGLGHLSAIAPKATRWLIGLPHGRSSDLVVFWNDRDLRTGGSTSGQENLSAVTGIPIAHRETRGGQLLYQMHYRFHYLPVHIAEWIVGICTMFLLVVILTGVIVHKRIFRDFFMFRIRKGQRSWLDAHNVLSVIALPFHLMITYSGLLFFVYLYMAPVIAASYGLGGDARATYFNELLERDRIPDSADLPVPLTNIAPLFERVESRVGTIQFINIYNPGDANARIIFYAGRLTPRRSFNELTFDGATGRLMHESAPHSAPLVTFQTLLGLHEGLFAGPVLRWIYFLSGLIGTAMIGAGLVLWTTKRRAKSSDTFGFRLVERLNIGTIVGLPVAIAAYFWANRLIPVGIEGRAAWEAHAMFIAWAVMLAHAFIRPASRGWTEQLWVAAGAFGLLPLLNALTTDKHLGVTLPAGAWELASFDLTVVAFGIAFAVTAWQVGRRRRSDREHDQETWTPAHQETEAAE